MFIASGVVPHKEHIKQCVELQRSSRPGAVGRVTVHWLIEPDGTVRDIKVIDADSTNRVMADCLTKEIKTWRFPSTPSGKPVPVDFPFKF